MDPNFVEVPMFEETELRQDTYTGLVHVVVERIFMVNLGDGNVGTEDIEVALCDLVTGRDWEEQHPQDLVTCLSCLERHLRSLILVERTPCRASNLLTARASR